MDLRPGIAAIGFPDLRYPRSARDVCHKRTNDCRRQRTSGVRWLTASGLEAHPFETIFVPDGHWGSYAIRDSGVVSQHEGVFERYMGSMMAEPIIGSLGGNILKHFRIELDYAKQMLYLSQPERATQ